MTPKALQGEHEICYTRSMDGTPSNRSKIRVLLLSDTSVLDFAVEDMLHENAVIETVGPEAGLDETLQRIRAFVPDVIILNQARQRKDSALLWPRMVGDLSGVRLIALNATETSMSIYEGGTHTIRAAADLLDAVQQSASELLGAP
jgi:chemotaxis response regulator CheB